MNKKRFKYAIILFILISLFYASYYLLKTSNINISEGVKEVFNSNKDNIKIDISDLVATSTNIKSLRDEYNNDEIIATIKIDNTSIDEVVSQTIDNDYYLNHTSSREYDKYGSVFMDYRVDINSSKKILIYGHNSSHYDTDIVPFKELENYYEEDYYTNHKYITLTLDGEIRRYIIFSVYVEASDFSYMNMNFNSTEDWYKHITELKNKSLYDTDVTLNEEDEVLILQTCSYNKNYSDYNKKYLLVVAKRV